MQQIDNSHLPEKVWLRIHHLPLSGLSVLDCYGGFGVVWSEVTRITGRRVDRLGIDKQKRPGCLHGDNRKWLQSLDLSAFNVIDLDAYGIPFAQAAIIFKRQYVGTVFFTFIQSEFGKLPAGLLDANGITAAMRRKCQTLYNAIGWRLWLDWLGNNGVTRVHLYQRQRKYYGSFVL